MADRAAELLSGISWLLAMLNSTTDNLFRRQRLSVDRARSEGRYCAPDVESGAGE